MKSLPVASLRKRLHVFQTPIPVDSGVYFYFHRANKLTISLSAISVTILPQNIYFLIDFNSSQSHCTIRNFSVGNNSVDEIFISGVNNGVPQLYLFRSIENDRSSSLESRQDLAADENVVVLDVTSGCYVPDKVQCCGRGQCFKSYAISSCRCDPGFVGVNCEFLLIRKNISMETSPKDYNLLQFETQRSECPDMNRPGYSGNELRTSSSIKDRFSLQCLPSESLDENCTILIHVLKKMASHLSTSSFSSRLPLLSDIFNLELKDACDSKVHSVNVSVKLSVLELSTREDNVSFSNSFIHLLSTLSFSGTKSDVLETALLILEQILNSRSLLRSSTFGQYIDPNSIQINTLASKSLIVFS